MDIHQQNPDHQLQAQQVPVVRPPIAESFLRSSNKMIECDKCRQMINFQKLDIHELLCKGSPVQCIYCGQSVPIKQINLHELRCPVKKQFDRQQRLQKLKPKNSPPKMIPKANKVQQKTINKPKIDQKPQRIEQKMQRSQSMALLYNPQGLNVNPEQKLIELEVKPQKKVDPQVQPQQKVEAMELDLKKKVQYVMPKKNVEIEVKLEKKEQEKNQKPKEKEKPRVLKAQKPKPQKTQPKRVLIKKQIIEHPRPLNRQIYNPMNQYRPINYVPQQPARNTARLMNPFEEIPFIPPEPQAKKSLTQTKIHRLPRTNYEQNEQNAATECSICYENFEENQELVQLETCKHLFHHQCIAVWLKSDSRCAICKRQVKVLPKPQN